MVADIVKYGNDSVYDYKYRSRADFYNNISEIPKKVNNSTKNNSLVGLLGYR